MRAAILIVAAFIPLGANAQSFSCSGISRPACLGYGDTICSSSGKCVSSDAVCFSSYQCGYEGFTCKSNLTEAHDTNDTLRAKFNRLVDDYNELLDKNKSMVAVYNDLLDRNNQLVDDYNDLLDSGKRLTSAFDDFSRCVSFASSLDEAQDCKGYR